MAILQKGAKAPDFSLSSTPDQKVCLSDFEPKGDVAKKYGAYREKDGFAERAIFLIDGNGVINWSYLSPVGVNPGVDGLLDALDELKARKKAEAA